MQVSFSPDDLRPVIAQIVAEMLDKLGDAQNIAIPEADAAAAIGVKPHVLRDCRLRGEICGAKIGRGYKYTRADLIQFVERRRTSGPETET